MTKNKHPVMKGAILFRDYLQKLDTPIAPSMIEVGVMPVIYLINDNIGCHDNNGSSYVLAVNTPVT